MRAAPALQVSVTAFGVWRAATVLLAATAVAMPPVWLIAHAEWLPLPAVVLAATASAAALLFGIALVRVSPRTLRWDGQRWHVGPLASVGNEPWHGELHVAVDLGPWMLLRFQTESPAPRVVVWLPVQRRGLEAVWHALRCTVYAPRTRAASGTADSNAL